MPDPIPEPHPSARPGPGRSTAGRSARTRSSSTTAASTSSRGCPSGARGASRCCSSTASWPARGSGSATSATSPAAAGRATRSTCATTTGRRPPTRPSSRSTPTPRTWSRRSTGSARRPWRSATGWAACWRSRPPSASPICGRRAHQRRSCRATCAHPARAFELREIPEVYGRSVIGWETLPEKLQRDDRDLTLADVLRIQHLLGQKPHEAGRGAAPDAGRRAGRPRVFAEVPRLVIGGGLDRIVPARRVRSAWPTWLGAEYEPFGAHSHYGLVVGEQSYQQVAEAIRGVPGDAPALGARRWGRGARVRLRLRRRRWYPVGRPARLRPPTPRAAFV